MQRDDYPSRRAAAGGPETVGAVLDVSNCLIFGDFPPLSIVYPADVLNPLMPVLAITFVNALNLDVLSQDKVLLFSESSPN
jgi:hypothetical protein